MPVPVTAASSRPAETITGLVVNATSRVAPRIAGRAAMFLFRSPLGRGRLRRDELTAHHRAVTGTVAINGKQVMTYRWGDGRRPVLLVHGWQSRASRYAQLIERLEARGFSAIGFDAPGHGASGGRTTTILEYQQIIEQLRGPYGPFEAIVGHSFGVLASYLAVRGDRGTGRLVAFAGVSDFGFLADEFAHRLCLQPQVTDQLRRRIAGDLFPHTPRPWEQFDATARIGEITVPILVVHDQDDTTVPIEQAHRLKTAYGDQLTLWPTTGLGHHRILTDPAVIERVLNFLDAPRDEPVRFAAGVPLAGRASAHVGGCVDNPCQVDQTSAKAP